MVRVVQRECEVSARSSSHNVGKGHGIDRHDVGKDHGIERVDTLDPGVADSNPTAPIDSAHQPLAPQY